MPWSVSSHATPSSTSSYLAPLLEIMKAKITAASVANASTTAPRLTRRFCFMPRLDMGYTFP